MIKTFIFTLLLIPNILWAEHARVLLHDRSVRMEETGLSHVTDTYRIRIDDWTGANQLGVLRLDYDPATNVVKFNYIRVIHKNGKITEVPVERVADLPQPQRWIYWGTRMKLASVPGLKPGDILEYQTYKKGFTIAYLKGPDERYIPPMRGHYYEVVAFIHKWPCDVMRYSLLIPRDKTLQFGVYHGSLQGSQRVTAKGIEYTWVARNLPAMPDEPDQVEPNDMAIKLVLTTVPDWQTKSRWFYETNKNQFQANEAIRKKTAQVIKGAHTDMEKARRLLRWVAEHIRYAGINMGKGEGYTLHPGTMTFHDRCGVCKDIAGMLITMMKVAGLDVYPAMTMAGENVEDVPADQFNHCVVAWRQKDGSFIMLDPTWAPASSLLWCNAEFQQPFLVGTPKGQTLMQTPYVPAKANTLNVTARSRVDKKGDLYSTVTIEGTGYADTRLRRNFNYLPYNRWQEAFRSMVRDISPAGVLIKWRVKHLKDLDKPVRLSFTYQVKHWAVPGSKAWAMRVPLAAPLFRHNHRFSPFLSASKAKTRKTAAWFWATWRYKAHEVVKLPGRYTLKKALFRQVKGGGATGTVSLKQKGARLVFDSEFSFSKRRVKASEYKAFKRVTDLMREGVGHWYILGGKR